VLLFLFWSLLPKKLSAARERVREREKQKETCMEERQERGEGRTRENRRDGESKRPCFPTLSSKRNFTVLPDICMDFRFFLCEQKNKTKSALG